MTAAHWACMFVSYGACALAQHVDKEWLGWCLAILSGVLAGIAWSGHV